jgi:hypothetical protein
MGPFLVLASEPCMGYIARYFPALALTASFSTARSAYIFFSFAFSASSFFKRFRYCLFAMIGGGLPKWQDWFGYRRPTFDIRIGLRIQQQLINISS